MRYLMIDDRVADGRDPYAGEPRPLGGNRWPLFPDTGRCADTYWKDNLGEWDTFDVPPDVSPRTKAAPAKSTGQPNGPTSDPQLRLLRCRECGRAEARLPEELLLRFARSGWPECCGRVMDYFAFLGTAVAVPSHQAAI